jgi:hypothetical protein
MLPACRAEARCPKTPFALLPRPIRQNGMAKSRKTATLKTSMASSKGLPGALSMSGSSQRLISSRTGVGFLSLNEPFEFEGPFSYATSRLDR